MSSPFPRIESGGAYIVDGTPAPASPIELWVRAQDLLATATAPAPLLQDKIQPFNCAGGSITASTLPALAGLPLRARFAAAKTDTSANTLTLPFAAGDTLLDGSTSILMSVQGTVELQVVTNPAGGKLWRVVNHVRSDAAVSGVSQAQLNTAVAGLVNSAPTTLDTLKELADALGDDPNYATTITNLLGLKAPLASPGFTGTPVAPTPSTGDATTKLATTAFVARDYVPTPTGTPDGTKFLRDDNSWEAPPSGMPYRYQSNGATSPNILLGDPTAASAAIATDVSGGVLLNPGGTGYNNIVGGDGSATVGTTTPNVSSTGTGANQSVIGGYDSVAGALSSKIIADHSYVGTDATTGHNAIYGGANNKIDGVATGFCAILGGYQSHVSGAYSMAQGYLNTVNAQSAVALGDHQSVTGNGALASGTTNTVSGPYARAHGSTNTATGSFSSAEGFHANARRYGQHAFASGRVATDGDVQTSFHTAFGTTTDATPQTLGVDGGTTYNSNHQMLRGQTVMVQAMVVGRSTAGGTQVGFVVRALVHFESSGNAAVIGTPSVEAFNAPAGCAATIIAALSVGQLAVQVTGIAATTIQWSARIDLVESLLA